MKLWKVRPCLWPRVLVQVVEEPTPWAQEDLRVCLVGLRRLPVAPRVLERGRGLLVRPWKGLVLGGWRPLPAFVVEVGFRLVVVGLISLVNWSYLVLLGRVSLVYLVICSAI